MKSLNEFTIFTSQSKIDNLSMKLVIINVKYQGVDSAFWVKLDWLWSLFSQPYAKLKYMILAFILDYQLDNAKTVK